LKGLLEPVLVHVNYINAPEQAKRRGITVLQANGAASATSDYPNLVSCRVEWSGGSRIVAGTLFNHNEPRLVQVDNYRLDVRPEGIIVIVRNQDRPGFIGRVGTLLGQNNINIASWRYGRTAPYDHALCFIAVDEDVPDNVIEVIQAIDLVEYVKKVRL
jgi:D-3-phosphoglycerate dehydrogenase / 2-oxoglutarate reductase